MGKISAKNAMILVNGNNLSAFADSYNVDKTVTPVDVTCFGDGVHNFQPSLQNSKIGVNFYWDTTATTGVYAYLQGLGTGQLTVIPETVALGTPAFSLPYQQTNFAPQGTPAAMIKLGTVNFLQRASSALIPSYGVEDGLIVQHATITSTTTSAAVDLGAAIAGTARNVSGILHVRIPTATDTYVVKIRHCATSGGGYADLLTFTSDGKTMTAERQVGTPSLLEFIKVQATRTGSAGDNFGFTVLLWHS
jgi:hypothetical protein